MEISSLYAKLGFKVDDSGLKKFKEYLDSLKTLMSKMPKNNEYKDALNSLKIDKERLNVEKLKAQIKKISLDTEIRKQKQLLEEKKEERLKAKEERLASASHMKGMISGAKQFAFWFYEASRQSIERGNAFRNLSYVTGLDPDRLRSLQYTMERGGTVLGRQDIASMVQGLQQKMIDIRLGKGDITPFTMLGVSAYGQDPFRVLQDISKSIKNIDNATASNILGQLGLGHPDMIRMLRGGINAGGIGISSMPTNQEIRTLSQLGISFRQLSFVVKNFRDRFFGQFDNMAAFVKDISDSLEIIVQKIIPIVDFIENGLGYAIGYAVGYVERAVENGVTMFLEKFPFFGETPRPAPVDEKGKAYPDLGIDEDEARSTNFLSTPEGEKVNDWVNRALDDGIFSKEEYNSVVNNIFNMKVDAEFKRILEDYAEGIYKHNNMAQYEPSTRTYEV